ncbi:MAG: P pilus assembly/Cpx signaling pathway, periplasmic inhibitor/zinc-resistance associated protein [Cyanobacteria bacterium J06635_10]
MLNLKRTSLIFATILTIGTAGAAFANVQTSSNNSVVISRAKGQGKLQRLNLTDEQKTQMQAIKEDARAQMKEILTQEQLEKLETAKANGQKKRGVWRTLNLTEDQKAELKKIKESKTSQIEAILTDEQKEQFQQMRENRRSRR